MPSEPRALPAGPPALHNHVVPAPVCHQTPVREPAENPAVFFTTVIPRLAPWSVKTL